LDDDDYVSQTYLEEMLSLTTGNNIVLCYPYAFNDGYAAQQLPYRITDAYNRCAGKSNISINSVARKFFSGPCMKLIPANYVKGQRFDVRCKVGEDSLFMFLISNKIKDIVFTSRNAIYYRRCRAGSARFTSNTKQRIQNAIHLIKAYSQIYFSNMGEYSLLFYITRALGCLRSIIHI
jgi:hypothetical protein